MIKRHLPLSIFLIAGILLTSCAASKKFTEISMVICVRNATGGEPTLFLLLAPAVRCLAIDDVAHVNDALVIRSVGATDDHKLLGPRVPYRAVCIAKNVINMIGRLHVQ